MLPRDYRLLDLKIKDKFKTHKAFAKAMGINPCLLSRVFNGKAFLTVTQMELACELLECPIDMVHLLFFAH